MLSSLGTVRGSLTIGRISSLQRQWVRRRPSTTIISTHRTKSTTTIHNTNDENINDKQYNAIIKGTISSYGKGLEVGQFAELHRTYRHHDVQKFGSLIGDYNPVHGFPPPDDRSKNEDTQHYNIQQQNLINGDRPIVHGTLLASAFSTIFGTLIPFCLYRSQSLKFHHPVYIDEHVVGKVIVTKLKQVNRRDASGILCTCDTTLHKADNDARVEKEENILCISGEAQVWLPGATLKS